MFHNFFGSLAKSRYLSRFLHSFVFPQWSTGMAKSAIWQVLFFLLINTRSGILAWFEWSISISMSQRILCILFYRTYSGLCISHLSVWSSFNLLHNSQRITLPTESCLLLYSFCASLLHSLMYLTVSSLSPYSLDMHINFYLDIVRLYGIILHST